MPRPSLKRPNSVDSRAERRWVEALFESRNAAERKNAWNALASKIAAGERLLTSGDQRELLEGLLAEPDVDVRSFGLTVLQLGARASRLGFAAALWAPFGPTRDAAVIAVNDKAHIKDVAPLVELGRFFPRGTHPRMTFHTVSLLDPDWAPVRPEELDAMCLIGRRSMFRKNAVLGALEDENGPDLGLRFNLPKASVPRPSRSVDSTYHHVLERRPIGTIEYPTDEHDGQRTDYAAVQRMWTRFGGRRVTVLFIEGATSLGTSGAASWVTSATALEALDAHDLSDGSTIEILLRVTAAVHQPERPWEPRTTPLKAFVNGTNVIAKTPRVVTLGIPADRPLEAGCIQHVLLNDDEVEFRGERYDTLVAVCLKAYLNELEGKPPDTILVDGLERDSRLWTSPWRPTFPTFYRDHLQRQLLHGVLSVNDKAALLKLSCKIVLQRS